MEPKENLFQEFAGISKEEWLAKAARDLRGKPLEDLFYHLGDDITIAPFYHPEDMDRSPAPVITGPAGRQWETGQLVDVRDIEEANTAFSECLENGVEAPLLILHRELNDTEIARLFNNIDLTGISTHFTHLYSGRQPLQLMYRFYNLLEARGFPPGEIRGSIDYDPMLDWSKPPYDDLATAIRFCSAQMPHFRMLQINGLRFHSGPENTAQELALIIAKGSEYLAQLEKREIGPDEANRNLQFNVALSTSYFVEIAKLRALRILWANILAAYGAAVAPAPIIAHFAGETHRADQHANMIQAGAQAMSAVIGGVDRLYVRPADFSQQKTGTPFTQRIARNVQHLLRLESHLGQVADPGAGSYYIEKLTDKLAEQAWKEFQQLEARQEFG